MKMGIDMGMVSREGFNFHLPVLQGALIKLRDVVSHGSS